MKPKCYVGIAKSPVFFLSAANKIYNEHLITQVSWAWLRNSCFVVTLELHEAPRFFLFDVSISPSILQVYEKLGVEDSQKLSQFLSSCQLASRDRAERISQALILGQVKYERGREYDD